MVLGYEGWDVERERAGERQRPADVVRGRVLQPGHQPVVLAERMVGLGLIEHHFTPQFYLDLEGSICGVNWSNMGGGCNSSACRLPPRVNPRTARFRPSAFSWLIGADLGWNPVTNLNFDLELMYQSTNPGAPSGFLGTVYNWGQANQFFVPGDWHGQQQRFRGPSPHHPLLLIASRSVETPSPGAKAPGFFVGPWRRRRIPSALSHIRACARARRGR